MHPHRRLALALLAAAVLAAGCITPSIPLPPPDASAMTFTLDASAGTAFFQADRQVDWGDAKVSVYDEDSGYGVIVRANPDGSVDPTPSFIAREGDRVFVSYEVDDQAAGLCLVLHHGRASDGWSCF